MANISQIKLPNGDVYNFQDSVSGYLVPSDIEGKVDNFHIQIGEQISGDYYSIDKTYADIFAVILAGKDYVTCSDVDLGYPYVGIASINNNTVIAFGISATFDNMAYLDGYLILPNDTAMHVHEATIIPTKTSQLTNDSGFITSYTETDPIFNASVAAGITSTDITNWNSKSAATNWVNGSQTGSVRTANSAAEDSSYTMGLQAVAEGGGTKASGDFSHAEGGGTVASGNTSHAEGGGTTASGIGSHAEGGSTQANGQNSHAEGSGTTASDSASHAEGGATTASGEASHAEGGATTASGDASHAEGGGTTASGYTSHAEGSSTIASHRAQHVFGEFNITDSSGADSTERGDYVEIVGNGSSSARSNARTLDWSGNEWLAGKLTLGTTGTNSMDVATIGQLPTKVSDLTNDSGFITGYTETDPTVPSWAKASSKPTYTASEVGALPSSTTYVSKITTTAGAHSAISKKSGAVSFNVPTTAAHVGIKFGYTTSGNNRAVLQDSSGNLYVTQKDDNTTYSSKAAASGGTDVSLVTTGEKYTWNSKTSNTGTVTSVAASGSGGITISGSPITTSGTISIGLNLSTAINGLGEGTAQANINDYAVVQYAGGGTTTTTYHRRKLSNLIVGKAVSDQNGLRIDTGYLKLTGGQVTGPTTFGDTVSIDDLNVGQLVVSGDASITNNLQVNTINGVTVGSSPKFTDTTYSSLTAASGGTAVSLVTTGEKYTWNSKTSNTGTVTSVAVSNGGGLSVSGSPITSSGTITISHADTSSQASSSNSGRTYIQSLTLDTYGHVTGISTATETVTNTDEKLKVVEITSATQYYPLVGTATAGATGAIRQYDTTGFKYKGTNGTTSAVGSATVELGNSTASGTAGNKQAQLIMYGSNAKKATITLAAPSADIALALPTSGGTLALTSQIPTVSYPVTSVNSKTGAVSLTASDVGALASNTTYVSKITTTAGAHSTISNKSGAVSFNVPTKTSHLTNDSGFTTNTGTVTKVTAGTGLSIGTTSGGNFTTSGTINHTNSVTAQTTQALYPIKIDAQGHISAYGSAITSLPASDVSAWAKAATKPTYTPSEIGAADASDIPTVSTITVNTTTTKGTFIGSSCHKYGRVVTLTFRFRNTSSIASGADLYTGTLSSSLPLPYDTVTSITSYGAHALVGVLLADRSLTIRNASNSAVQFGSNSTASMSFTYVCQ